MQTQQMAIWAGDFGAQYTDRNNMSAEELELCYQQDYGITRAAMNTQFLGDLPRDLRILEVGTNIGNQLLVLRGMGFENLVGIELQRYAVGCAKQRTFDCGILQGSIFDIPFKDRYFDLVFTSGVLIHIAPADLPAALSEVVRCTRRYVWGFEYWAPEDTTVTYRGSADLLWKADYAAHYLKQFPDLRMLKERRYPYVRQPDMTDSMFLLERASSS